MDPLRSSIVGGVIATAVMTALLLVIDVLVRGANLFVFATFTSLCEVGGPPYCAVASPEAAALTYLWFFALYALAWPILFAGVTWGLPGESGLTHGAIYGTILWAGYLVVVLYGIGRGELTIAENLPLLVLTLVAYLVYGVVLGGAYDYLAEHRTFMSPDVD